MYKNFIILVCSVGATELLHAQNTCIDPFPHDALLQLHVRKSQTNELNRTISLADDYFSFTPVAEIVPVDSNHLQLRASSGELVASASIDASSNNCVRLIIKDCNDHVIATVIKGTQTITDQAHPLGVIEYAIFDDQNTLQQYGYTPRMVWGITEFKSVNGGDHIASLLPYPTDEALAGTLTDSKATGNLINDPRVMSLLIATTEHHTNVSAGVIIGAIYGAAFAVLVAVGGLVYWIKAKRSHDLKSNAIPLEMTQITSATVETGAMDQTDYSAQNTLPFSTQHDAFAPYEDGAGVGPDVTLMANAGQANTAPQPA